MLYVILYYAPFLVSATAVDNTIQTSSSQSSPRDGRAMLQHTTVEVGQRAEPMTLAEARAITSNIDDAFAKAEALDNALSESKNNSEHLSLQNKSANLSLQKSHVKKHAKAHLKKHAKAHLKKHAKAARKAEHARGSFVEIESGGSKKADLREVDRMLIGSNMSFEIKSLSEAINMSRNMDDAFARAEAMDSMLSGSNATATEEVAKALGLPKALQLVQIEDVARSVTAKFRSKGKAEPMGIAKWIKDQMIPQTELTKIEMAKEVARAASAVDACESILHATDKDAHKREVTVRTAEARYKECNASLAKLISDTEVACDDLKDYSDRLDIPTCLDRVYRHSSDLMESTLRKNWEFFNSVYPQFMEKKKLCEDMKISKDGKGTQCVREQRLLEGALCALRSARKTACEEYAICRDTMVEKFNKAKTDVKILEEKTKDEYKSLHRIECFISILVEGEQVDAQEAAAQSCNPDSVDVTHLSIDYPSPAAANSCETIIATSEDYSSLECPAELEESSDVSSEAETVETVESDESAATEDSGADKTEEETALAQLVPPEATTLQLDQRSHVRDVQKWAEKRRLPNSQRQKRARRQRRQYAYAEGNARVPKH